MSDLDKVIVPTTEHGSQQRDVGKTLVSFPGNIGTINHAYGTVTEVHPSKPLVRAVEDTGAGRNATIANDEWIPVKHSTSEIAERWGTLRTGMKVEVSYSGPDGAQARATIIGVEDDEHNGQSSLQANTSKKGLYRIFAPGIGIG